MYNTVMYTSSLYAYALKGKAMTEKPTENTYVVELVKAISNVGGKLGFDAEAFLRTAAGYPDVVLKYNGKAVAVIEVKPPSILLYDPELERQALRYAEWYRRNKGVELYGVHNMKYIALYRYREKLTKGKITLLDYTSIKETRWVPAVDFPFPIIPWATSLNDYKAITTNKQARENLERFLLALKELLEDKTLDLSKEVIGRLRSLIEKAADNGKYQLKNEYDKNTNVRNLVEQWLGERGFERPRNDEELIRYLELLLKEQAYSFTVKLLFYLVLQSIDIDMAGKLKESVKALESLSEPELFRKLAEELFKYAINKTGDFEEVFGTNIVENLPIMPASLESYREIVGYLSQVKWSNVSVDVLGRIFEGLIHEERRHLLGQHYTDEKIVDLILEGVFRKSDKPGSFLDPACGSGTFLARALLRWRIKQPEETRKLRAYELLEGCDIDKLAAMLAKVNLYVQSLEYIEEQTHVGSKWFTPRIYHADFFKRNLGASYIYVATNPPYTRQEEMALAYLVKDYKTLLKGVVSDIEGWDERASIYAYFLVRGGKLLKEGGRLGYIVENSWLNAEYGKPLRKWLLSNFRVEYIIESLVERWFEDADVITNIIVAERGKPDEDTVIRFIYLKKPLRELVGEVPPASDVTAMLNYYKKIAKIYVDADNCSPNLIAQNKHEQELKICEDDNARVVAVKRGFLDLVESRIGRLGVFRGPKAYLDLILEFLEGHVNRFILLGDLLRVKRGLTTNANELFYLPSKWWRLHKDTDDYLELIYTGSPKVIRLSKRYLRRLIRLEHLQGQPYEVTSLPKLGREDYVLWIENVNAVDFETQHYIDWLKEQVGKGKETKGKKGRAKYSTLISRMNEPTWLKLTSASGGHFVFRGNIDRNFSSWLLGTNLSNAEPDQRLYIGYVKEGHKHLDKKVLFAVLNSVLTYISVELVGKRLGGGVLYLATTDYENVPIVNPYKLQEFLIESGKLDLFKKAVDTMLATVPSKIDIEAKRMERLEVEKFIFEFLGLPMNVIFNLYEELIRLVNLRVGVGKKSK